MVEMVEIVEEEVLTTVQMEITQGTDMMELVQQPIMNKQLI
jgi:hypothetical protein